MMNPLFLSLFILDGSSAHRVDQMKAICKKYNIHLAIIPSSCTDAIKLVDVAIGALFKNQLYERWATWMLSEDRQYFNQYRTTESKLTLTR